MTARDRLSAYLQRQQLTQRALAREIGITEAYLSQLLSGLRTPGLVNAIKIEDMTGIPARGWRRWRTPKSSLHNTGYGANAIPPDGPLTPT